MIRPFTVVTMLLAAASGLYLYQSKHRVQMLDRDIGRTWKSVEEARARTGLLRAEWALLNEPDRLGELADRHLALKPLAPGQFISMADLERRLPPPGSASSHDAAPLEPQELPPAGSATTSGPAPIGGPADHPSDPARAPAPSAAASSQKPTATASNDKPPGSTLAKPATRGANGSSSHGTSIASASAAGPGAMPAGDATTTHASLATPISAAITPARTDGSPRPSRAASSATADTPMAVPVVATSLGGTHPALAAPVPYTPSGAGAR